ncbi:MAG: hypothetical protein KJO98_04975 [Rhodothermia bacterium]|nr:hypothetical protein [Rhodothermia bacterium]
MDFLPFVWVLIPLAAIAVGAFKEWLKFKAKQDRLGTSTAELERLVGGLRDDLKQSEDSRQRLVERIQNLETIVTTEMWDIVHGAPGQRESRARPPQRQPQLDLPEMERKPRLDVPEQEDETADRVSKIADRLRNM